MLLYFPMLFFAGIYLPLEIMPVGIRTLSSWTPPGAAVQALGDAWAGTVPSGTSLLVLVATATVAGALAAGSFRWE
jgi:ABC-2 type transport system permease protein